MKYRVDNIPLLLRPPYLLAAWFLGTLFALSYWFVRRTTRAEYIGREKIEALPNAIYCLWHENWIPYFIYFPKHTNHIWMCHAAWYMRHILVILWWLGVREYVLGSTGDGGREAAIRLVEELKRGKSTVVSPDGPYGPSKQLKKGALHLAKQSGAPLVAIEFQLSHVWKIPWTWEGKQYPRPFSTARVIFHEPVYVTEENFSTLVSEFGKSMG